MIHPSDGTVPYLIYQLAWGAAWLSLGLAIDVRALRVRFALRRRRTR